MGKNNQLLDYIIAGLIFVISNLVLFFIEDLPPYFRTALFFIFGFALVLLIVIKKSPQKSFRDILETFQRNKRVKEYRYAAEEGVIVAQNGLGLMYANGWGVEQDYDEAKKWFQIAAKQEDAEAQVNLGNMYYHGWGVEQDYAEAVYWYRRAAEQKYAQAQVNLGVMYQNGWGVEQDDTEVRRWYSRAAEQEHADAQCNLGLMYYHGWGGWKDLTQALEYFRHAAHQGHAIALYYLGLFYEIGWIVGPHYGKAYMWTYLAVQQGCEEAKEKCNEFKKKSTETEIKEAKESAKKWLEKWHTPKKDDSGWWLIGKRLIAKRDELWANLRRLVNQRLDFLSRDER